MPFNPENRERSKDAIIYMARVMDRQAYATSTTYRATADHYTYQLVDYIYGQGANDQHQADDEWFTNWRNSASSALDVQEGTEPA